MKNIEEIPANGMVTLTPKGAIIAGARVTLKVRYLVGSEGVAEGGSLIIGFPEDWEPPVAPRMYMVSWLPKTIEGQWGEIEPYSPRNIALDLSTDGLATLRAVAERNWMRVIVQHAALVAGDTITVTYGDTTWGGTGALVSSCPRSDQKIVVLLDSKGNGEYTDVEGSPVEVETIPGPPSKLNPAAPSLVEPEELFEVRLAVQDACGNRPDELFVGSVSARPLFSAKVKRKRSRTLFRRSFQEKDNNHLIIPKVRAGVTGALKMAVVDETGELFGVSNPILAEPRAEGEEVQQIYWGDINGKSGYTGGARQTGLDEYYDYAREMANLDFSAVTDSMSAFNEEAWAATQEAAERYSESGKFLAFKAFEWSSNIFGHRAIYFKDVEKTPVLECDGDPGGMDVRHFYGLLQGKDVIVVPTHTFVWMDWGFHDPIIERLVEIHSGWGTSERPGNPNWIHSEIPGGGVQQGLARGYKLGIIAGSDTRVGMPGRGFPERTPLMPFKGGLTAVLATELTREAVFDALWNRRCYATTGPRIILKFFLNGQVMGSQVEVPRDHQEEPRVIRVVVAAAGDMESVQIVRNNEDIYSLNDCGDYVEIDYEDDEPLDEALAEARANDVGAGSLYYYVRVTQKDGEVAWSSPIWVTLGPSAEETGRVRPQAEAEEPAEEGAAEPTEETPAETGEEAAPEPAAEAAPEPAAAGAAEAAAACAAEAAEEAAEETAEEAPEEGEGEEPAAEEKPEETSSDETPAETEESPETPPDESAQQEESGKEEE